MIILVPLHQIKAGNDKVSLESLFLRCFINKGLGVQQYAYDHRKQGGETQLFLYWKTKNVQIHNYDKNWSELPYSWKTIFVRNKRELEQMLMMALVVLCDENDWFVTPFCNTKFTIVPFLSKNPILCEVDGFHL